MSLSNSTHAILTTPFQLSQFLPFMVSSLLDNKIAVIDKFVESLSLAVGK